MSSFQLRNCDAIWNWSGDLTIRIKNEKGGKVSRFFKGIEKLPEFLCCCYGTFKMVVEGGGFLDICTEGCLEEIP
jgi:hypothetical protein